MAVIRSNLRTVLMDDCLDKKVSTVVSINSASQQNYYCWFHVNFFQLDQKLHKPTNKKISANYCAIQSCHYRKRIQKLTTFHFWMKIKGKDVSNRAVFLRINETHN